MTAPIRMWRQIGASLHGLPSIQIKNVPDEVHSVLRRRAAEAGQSMQEYLLGLLTEQAAQPTLEEVLDRAARRGGAKLSFDDAVAAIRADRDSH